MTKFETQLTPAEKRLLESLDSPVKIQAFLNATPYSEDEFYRCPLRVLRERKAHCFDGALFAAMALHLIGHPPLILELIPNARDDDHILALFKRYDHWGAVAQSNFTGLRYREPVYRSLRELVMSYFEDFFNSAGEKTLVGYRGPINLKIFHRLDWMSATPVWKRCPPIWTATASFLSSPAKWPPVLPRWTSAVCALG
ncbi:MAG: hypothetical protein IMZ73_07505 [Chloroflexi bacterium]|nr:hypothetical protein [Chloroflexota bacterium]